MNWVNSREKVVIIIDDRLLAIRGDSVVSRLKGCLLTEHRTAQVKNTKVRRTPAERLSMAQAPSRGMED